MDFITLYHQAYWSMSGMAPARGRHNKPDIGCLAGKAGVYPACRVRRPVA
ncbi:hypothetical protein [Kosakonia radicincitans]|nr:hypothetical protein [Kosakonia radicincitans]